MHLVLGSTGGIGHWTAVKLVERGEPVRVLVRDPDRFRSSWPEANGVDVVVGDALVPDDVRRAAQGATTIFHCVNVPYAEWSAKALPMLSHSIAAAQAVGARARLSGKRLRVRPRSHRSRSGGPPHGAAHPQGPAPMADGAAPRGAPSLAGVGVHDRPHARLLRAVRREPAVRGDLPRSATGAADAVVRRPQRSDRVPLHAGRGEAMVRAGMDPGSDGEVYHVPGAGVTTPREFLELVARVAQSKSRPRAVPSWMVTLAGLFNAEAREFREDDVPEARTVHPRWLEVPAEVRRDPVHLVPTKGFARHLTGSVRIPDRRLDRRTRGERFLALPEESYLSRAGIPPRAGGMTRRPRHARLDPLGKPSLRPGFPDQQG